MRYALLVTITLAAIATIPAPARAATIITAVFSPGPAQTNLLCMALNAGKKAKEVTIEIVSTTTGAVEASNTLIRNPGQIVVTSDFSPTTSFCRVTGLGKKNVRVTFCARDVTNNCTQVITAP